MVKWQQVLENLHKDQIGKQAELERSREVYQPEKHKELRGEKDRILTEVATNRQQIEELGRNQKRLEGEIGQLKRIQDEISGKQAEIKLFEEKEKLVKFLCNHVFKNVSAQLSERFREEISLRADRSYKTIAEADEELFWGDNYQIVLRDLVDGVVRERHDDQARP